MFGLAWRAWGRDQQDLTDRLQENGIIQSTPVERAFRLVDRALFVPKEERPDREGGGGGRAGTASQEQQAYVDGPIRVLLPGGAAVHISAPHMYGLVLEKLGLEPGMSFLSVGSGSGYFNCMASVLVGRGGKSHGVERQEEVVAHARRCAATWRKNMEAMRKEQRRVAQEEAQGQKQSKEEEMKQPQSSSAEVKQNAESATTAAAAAAAAMSISRVSSGRSSPMSISRSHRDEDADADEMESAAEDASNASASGGAPATSITSPASHALPRPFATLELSSLSGGPSRRGVLGPAADMPPSLADGDSEAAAALQQSILPLTRVLQEYDLGVPQPSPSPVLSTHSGDSSGSSDEVAATSSWKPTISVPKVAVPDYVVGDAFDLDPAVCGLYDRIYIGASTPESYIPFFVSLLHPGGRIVGPFGSSMQVLTRRRDGSTATEKVSDVSYAPMVLPDPAEAGRPKPQLRFPQPVFNPPFGFSCLPPAMKAALDAMLMLQRRDGRECLPGRLPLCLWLHIMSYLPSDSYIDRATGDVPWAPDVTAHLCLARTKLKFADELALDTEDAKRLDSAEAALREALSHVEQVRDWLELRLPSTVPSDPTASAEPASVGGVVTDLPALRELRADPTRVSSGRNSCDPAADQVVQLYWLVHWLLLHVLTKHKPAAAMRVAKRLLALRPNDAVAWRMLALNAFADGLLPDALCACDHALGLLEPSSAGSSSEANPSKDRADVLALKELISQRMPAYRRNQQRMSARLMQMLMDGLLGHVVDAEEQPEDEDEEVEEAEEEEHEADEIEP